MTTSSAPEPADQRALAVSLFNRTWDLLETDRDDAGDRMLLATALASRLHWEGIGTDENYAAGDWLVAAGGANDGFVMFVSVSDGKILHQDKAPMHVYDFEMLDSNEALIACGYRKVVQYEFTGELPTPAG